MYEVFGDNPVTVLDADVPAVVENCVQDDPFLLGVVEFLFGFVESLVVLTEFSLHAVEGCFCVVKLYLPYLS